MNTTVNLSLPREQLTLLNDVKDLTEKLLASSVNKMYLTESQAAVRLNVSKATLRKWREGGWLRFYQEGDNVRYRADYLDEDFEKRALVKPYMEPLLKRARKK